MVQAYPRIGREIGMEEWKLPDGPHFVSFSVRDKALQEIVARSARAAMANGGDLVAVSEHGSRGHRTYDDTLEAVSAAATKAELVLTVEQSRIPFLLSDIRRVTRLKAEAPILQRRASEPLPFHEAVKLKNSKNPDEQLKTLAFERGLPFAILAAFYLRKQTDEIMALLGNKNWVRDKMPKGTRTLNFNDRRCLLELQDLLLNPVLEGLQVLPYSRRKYQQAVARLREEPWADYDWRREDQFDFVVTERPFLPRMVLKGADEVAYGYLSNCGATTLETENWIDMELTTKRIMTSRVITAYLAAQF